MKSIVVIGAGFGGAYAAKNILKRLPPGFNLILINKSELFTFKPLLHEVATGAFSADVVCECIKTFLSHKNLKFIKGIVTNIDFKKRTVAVNKKRINYNYLLISIGANTNFFNIPGAEKYSLKLDSVEDAFKIKNAIINVLERDSPRIVVVGGGPTGVELSSEIAEFTKQFKNDFSITVIERSNRIFPRFRTKFATYANKFFNKEKISLLLGTGVVKVGKNFVITDAKQKIPADLVVWTAGVKPCPVDVIPKTTVQNGFFPVDSYLRLNDYKDVFAVGDCALAKNQDGSLVPQLAQSAREEGVVASENILADINKKPLKKFFFNQKGVIIPLGKGHAIADIKGFVFSGFFAWWLNRTVYLMNMFGFFHKLYVVLNWTIGLFRKRDEKIS